jgi:pSer/pThr/pTyr-binding forkhead associated (FHA) protein
MKARLIDRSDVSEQVREIPLNQGEFLIGRGTDCDLRLRVSSVSRHHCLIRLTGDGATLVDLGSSNGTYLNGKRVRSQADLHHGDELRLGECCFLVELGEEDQLGLDTAVGADPFTTTLKIPKVTDPKSSQPANPSPLSQPPEKPEK